MAQLIYNPAKLRIMTEGLFPTGTEDYRLLLIDADLGYSPNVAHEFVSDVAAYELVTTGYARATLTSLSVHLIGNQAGLHADMVTFSGLGAVPYPTVQAGVVFQQVTDATDSPLVAYMDSVVAVTNGQDLIVTWDPNGIVYF